MSHTGNNIRHLRQLKGIKQDSMAKALNISQQAVSKTEKSKKISLDKLNRIAKILKVSVKEIIDFKYK